MKLIKVYSLWQIICVCFNKWWICITFAKCIYIIVALSIIFSAELKNNEYLPRQSSTEVSTDCAKDMPGFTTSVTSAVTWTVNGANVLLSGSIIVSVVEMSVSFNKNRPSEIDRPWLRLYKDGTFTVTLNVSELSLSPRVTPMSSSIKSELVFSS